MPSRRIPPTLKRSLVPNGRRALFRSTGVDGGFVQPPLAYSDPRLRAFLAVTFDVVYDWNIQTGAIYFGEQLDRMLGLRPGAFPRTSKAGSSGCTRTTASGCRCGLAEREQPAPFRCEYRLRHDDGSFRVIHDQGVILADEAGDPVNMIGAMRDVTDEREASSPCARPTNCTGSSSACPARPCRSMPRSLPRRR